jgi:hypothetical protein
MPAAGLTTTAACTLGRVATAADAPSPAVVNEALNNAVNTKATPKVTCSKIKCRHLAASLSWDSQPLTEATHKPCECQSYTIDESSLQVTKTTYSGLQEH